MTEQLSDLEAPSDAELISRVRAGDVAAYGELFERHVGAARRLAKQLVRGPDSEDLVSDAFAKVMQVLQGGGGPDVAFRAYLLTAVRRLHVDRVRAQARVTTSDDMTEFDPGVPFHDTAVANFESGAAAKAFASLPERWQLVLWHLEVEGQKPADIAPLLGMTPNSVSALAYRAREGLRQAFLTAHLADTSDAGCRWVTEHLGAYVREGLSKRDAAKVKDHLDECRQCTAMYLELTDVNSNLAAIIGPLLLGAAAAGYAATAGAGMSGAGGVSFLIGRARDVVLANTTTAVATGAVAATVAAGVSVGAVVAVQQLTGGHDADDVARKTTASGPAEPGSGGADQLDPSIAPVDAPIANLSVASAAISDDSVVLNLQGLPAQPVAINVDLTSSSGKTTFLANNGTCTVSVQSPSHAVCDPNLGGGGMSLMSIAPSAFEAVIPLSWPEDLEQDSLSIRVTIPGYADPTLGDNTATFTFVPSNDSEGVVDDPDEQLAADGPIAPAIVSTPASTPTTAPETPPTAGPTPGATPTNDPEPTADPTTDPTGNPTGHPTSNPTGDPMGEPTGPASPTPTGPGETTDPSPGDPTTDPSDPGDPGDPDGVEIIDAGNRTFTLGQPIRLSIDLDPSDASGWVTFGASSVSRSIPLCAAIVRNGHADCTIYWPLAVGTQEIWVYYSGDNDHPDARHTFDVEIVKAVATVSVADAEVDQGQAARIDVGVAADDFTPTGKVQIREDSTLLGEGTISNGSVTVTLPSSLTAGDHDLEATYVGDSQVGAKTSRFTLTVKATAPGIPAWSPNDRYSQGDWVTYDGKTYRVVVNPSDPGAYRNVTERPGNTYGAWMEYAVDQATGIQLWTPSWVFRAGDQMIYTDGEKYELDPKLQSSWERNTPPQVNNPTGSHWQLIKTNSADGKPIWTASRYFTSSSNDSDYAHEAWYAGQLYTPKSGQTALRNARPDTSSWAWDPVS